jgi:ABC-type transport system substrate-binding protein
MISLSRTASLLLARASLVVVMLSLAGFGAWTLGGLHGQPPPQKKPRAEEEEGTPKTKTPPGKKKHVKEEEEEDKNKPKRKVITVDDDTPSKAPKSRPSAPSASGDLKELAAQAKQPAVQKLFRSLAEPRDLESHKATQGVTVGGKTIPTEKLIPPAPRRLENVTPYENRALNTVRLFLKNNSDLSDYDKLIAAEQALSAVLSWHESARQTGQRRGDGWSAVESALRIRLFEVSLKRLDLLAQDKDWDRVLELTRRLALSYTNTNDRKKLLAPLAEMIVSALKNPTGSEQTKREARKRLRELEQEFPDNGAFEEIGKTLHDQAEGLLKQAKAALENKDKDDQAPQRALALLNQAKEIWPQLEGLQEFETQLGIEHPILRVGLRGQLPKYLSPAWAYTDNERRAVELLFESLVQLVPDGTGGSQYRPSLAEARPRVVRLGRQFELPHNAQWSDGNRLTAADVTFSMTMLQAGKGVGRSRVWGELLAAVESKTDPYQLTLRMKQGFLDPLALMSFKIVPYNCKDLVNGEAFALQPVTSGPFHLDTSRNSDEKGRECLIFLANPAYGLRPSKRHAPRIQEIRFYTCDDKTHNAVQELSHNKLDVVLDLTAQDVRELRQKQREGDRAIEVPLPSPAVPNRRIYFLAVNNAKIAEPKVRQAIAFAIDRETLLNKHFRGELKGVHKALNGPFPADSWASKLMANAQRPRNRPDLFDEDAAKYLKQDRSVLAAAKASQERAFKLKYPHGQPALDAAMNDLSEQVRKLTGIVLQPTPCEPHQLREAVEQIHDYDLAYYHYDFPDESYWLAPLLGPPPQADNAANIFHFQNGELAKTLRAARDHRDFAEVRKAMAAMQELLRLEMPFIPLWQLDPLLAYRTDVKPVGLEPLLVFGCIGEWWLATK